MPKTTLYDPREPADICRENGWTVGTRLVGDNGYGITIIEIAAIGGQAILARMVSQHGLAVNAPEIPWRLSYRDWQVVPGQGSTPPSKTPQGDAQAPWAGKVGFVRLRR